MLIVMDKYSWVSRTSMNLKNSFETGAVADVKAGRVASRYGKVPRLLKELPT